MDYARSTLLAIQKAADRQPAIESVAPGAWFVPSASIDGARRMVQIVHDVPGEPLGLWCACREEYGQQPPVGWCACWHQGAVALMLMVGRRIQFDEQRGFVVRLANEGEEHDHDRRELISS